MTADECWWVIALGDFISFVKTFANPSAGRHISDTILIGKRWLVKDEDFPNPIFYQESFTKLPMRLGLMGGTPMPLRWCRYLSSDIITWGQTPKTIAATIRATMVAFVSGSKVMGVVSVVTFQYMLRMILK